MTIPSADWLAAQRWFRSKGRSVARVVEVDRVVCGPAALTVVEVAYADGGAADRYLLPLVDGREPHDGEGAWRALVDAMAAGATLRGRTGRFDAIHTDALAALRNGGPERRLGVEQSNTSVRIGEALIIKLYRLLEPGLNPDLEVSAFLTEVGFAETPALAGAMTWIPEVGAPSAAAMLQAFVPSVGDAWAALLAALAKAPADGEPPADAVSLARQVGEVTARLHAALASRPSDAFPARTATVTETASWRASAEQQLALAVDALRGDERRRLVDLAPAVRARFADTFGAATGEARVTRIHGDLHLGQLLARTDGGFSIVDFEGEPARPLSERRAPSSPLRDVAGLLRSLDYAARTAAAADATLDADAWLAEARGALLDGYGGAHVAERPLLDAFELEKACYEVRYEASNRPGWLWLPLSAVERLVVADA